MASENYRHAYLLISLVLMLLVNPFIAVTVLRVTLIDVLFISILLTSIHACTSTRRQQSIAYGLAVGWQTFHWWHLLSPTRFTFFAEPGFGLLFFAYVTILNLRSVLQGGRVTADTIYGALNVYLLIGVVWVFAYVLLEAAEPNSFSFGTGAGAGVSKFERFVGFSYVTLTTLGYGNIVPMTRRADSLAVTEAIIGQIFLTVLVARLVGMHLSHASSEPKE